MLLLKTRTKTDNYDLSIRFSELYIIIIFLKK